MAWRPKKVFHGLWAVWSNYTTPIRGKLCLRLCFLNFVFYYLHRKGKKESEVTQLCPTLCNSMDCSLLGSSIHGIFQAGVLEWKFSSPGESSRPRDRTQVSHITGRHFNLWATREAQLKFCTKAFTKVAPCIFHFPYACFPLSCSGWEMHWSPPPPAQNSFMV